jgi:hypothetical protein
MKKKLLAKKKKAIKRASKSKSKAKPSDGAKFGGITVLKAGSSLAAMLISQSSNGMSVGPMY